jgi:hypothetical protein
MATLAAASSSSVDDRRLRFKGFTDSFQAIAVNEIPIHAATIFLR